MKDDKRQLDYSIALQRAIEHHCNGDQVPESIAKECPYHAAMLNTRPAPTADDSAVVEAARVILDRLPKGYALVDTGLCNLAKALAAHDAQQQAPAAPVVDEPPRCVAENCTEGYDAAMCADKACFVAAWDEAGSLPAPAESGVCADGLTGDGKLP